MSSHNIYLICACGESDLVYTGNADPENFTNNEWEGSIINTICDKCYEEGESK